MNEPLTVLLFTRGYPYRITNEHFFLQYEIDYLSSHFDRVIIVPQSIGGEKLIVPTNVEVEESYALSFEKNGRKRIRNHHHEFFSVLFIKELFKRPSLIFQMNALYRLIYFVIRTQNVKRWLLNFITKNKLPINRSIFYTYWLNHISMGIGLVKKIYHQVKLISRAHGADLYNYRYDPPYLPCIDEMLKSIDHLFLISEHGRNYIDNQYLKYTSKYELSRLGTIDSGFITQCSKDGVFRIASCSFMRPEKRVDLLWKGISYASKLKPNQVFEWHHIGDGELFKQIQDIVQREKTSNVKCYLYGYVLNVLSFYKINPIDIYLNVSKYEGIPVSIMEVQSCSIPVIATAVGGNPEIVSNENGKLLSTNPTPAEIGEAICNMVDNPASLRTKKKKSKETWQNNYDASVNFESFSKHLKLLASQR